MCEQVKTDKLNADLLIGYQPYIFSKEAIKMTFFFQYFICCRQELPYLSKVDMFPHKVL